MSMLEKLDTMEKRFNELDQKSQEPSFFANPESARAMLKEHAGLKRTIDRYREYIQSSKAEWSVAKNAYVQGRPGWFSERSACYLASGRPVVVQDTGLAGALPVGLGILTFRSLDEAAAAIREVEGNYARHAGAAREIAAECFGSDGVLTRLVEEAGRG